MVYFLSANKKTVVTVWILCSKHREAEWYKQISGLELIAVYQYDEELNISALFDLYISVNAHFNKLYPSKVHQHFSTYSQLKTYVASAKV